MSSDQYGSHDPYGQQPHDQQGGASPYGGGDNPAYGRDQNSNSWGDPVGQRSAGYVEGAPYAQSQPSAGYAQSQPSAAYGQAQGGYGQDQGQWQPAAAQPGPGPQAGPSAGGTASQDDSFFKALFDFGFTKYATPTLIKVYYIVGLILGALYWIGGGLFMMVAGSAASSYSSSDMSGAVMGIIWLLFGAPVFFFYMIALRMQLEMMIAMVRTNQDTKAIRSKLEN